MMRAEAAPKVAGQHALGAMRATSIDRRSLDSARRARSEPTKRASNSRSSSMRAASAGRLALRLLRPLP